MALFGRVAPADWAGLGAAACALLLSAGVTGCGRGAAYYVQAGNKLYDQEKYADATLNYRKAVQKDSGSGEAYLGLGKSLAAEGKGTEGYTALKQANEKAPNLGDAKIALAELLLSRYISDPQRPVQTYTELKDVIDRQLAKDPRCFDCLRIRGYVLLIDRKPAEALAAFEKASEIKPMDKDNTHGLAIALSQNGQTAEAEQLALKMIGADKTYGQIYDDLYEMYAAQGRRADAGQIFQLKVANNPADVSFRLQLAAHYFNTGQIPEMEAALKPLRDDRKTFPAAPLPLARFYMQLGRYPQAVSLLEDTARANASLRQKAWTLEVKAVAAEGRNDEAIRVTDRLVNSFPSDDEARLARVSLWLDSKDRSRASTALKELEVVRGKLGNTPIFWQAMGQAETILGDREKAGAAYRHAASLSPLFMLPRVSLAQLSLSGGKPDAALQYADDALRIDPTDPQARLLRANALVYGNRLPEAAAELTALAHAHPDLAEAQVELALIDIAGRKFPQAEAILTKFYKAGNPDLRALTGLVQIDMNEGRTQKALERLNADLKLNSNPDGVRNLIGQTEMAANDPQAAALQYTEIVKGQPRSTTNFMSLAIALRAKGDFSGAVNALQQAEHNAPNDARVVSMLAYLLQEAGRPQEAVDKFRRVLQLRPADLNTMNNLAYMLAESGRNLDEAERLADGASKVAPREPSYADTLAYVYIRKKMPGKAIEALRKAIQTSPDNTEYLYHLAMAQRDSGDQGQARATLRAALGKKPPKSEEARIRELLGQVSGPAEHN